MNAQRIAHYTGLSKRVVEGLLSLTSREIYRERRYLDALRQVDVSLLEDTLFEARSVYQDHLPAFTDMLSNQYGVDTTPMSPFTLGNWVVGMLHYPEQAEQLIDMHASLNRQVFVDNVETLVGYLDEMGRGRESWQQALVLLSLPLMAR